MSASLALACRLVLAGVLAGAAVTKIAARRALPLQLRSFGVPDRLVHPVQFGLPLAELAVAAALVATRSPAGAWAAAALLAGFTVLVVRAAVRRVPCPCFGSTAEPVGRVTLVRNAVLLGLAVVGTASVDGARGSTTALLALGVGAVVVVLIGAAR